ncbi:MAG: small subunit ribosomal protein S6 [Oceanicoccus sp.]|jgi:small subunit ribosomal protein S6
MKYEIMLILDPKQTDKEIEATLGTFKSGLAEHGFDVLDEDAWGTQDLAYKIKGRMSGYYVVLLFSGEPAGLDGFKKDLALMPGILRTLIQKVADDHVLLRYDELQTTKAGDAGATLSKHAEELSNKVASTSKSKPEVKETSKEDKKKLDEQLKAIIDDKEIDV